MLDRTFIRPIAHRGLHDASRGVIENTAPAFEAAIAAGHGIECDLRPAAGGLPVVFHDETLDRLIEASGRIDAVALPDLARLRHRVSGASISTFAQLLELVAGRVPLLVEIKSEWRTSNPAFLGQIGTLARAYRGPLALMSFDPSVMATMRALAPDIPRGIVSGIYRGDGWWSDVLDEPRREALSHFLTSGPAAPDFYAYQVGDLPTPVTRFVREVLGRPLFTWTVCKPADWCAARRWADAPIFEGVAPGPGA
jgi:glycerophosphoryl diester phosphodiesterase